MTDGFFDSRILIEEDGDFWLLQRPLVYAGLRDRWTIPAGFRTDLASVPRLLTWLVPKAGKHNRAAVVHDYLCRDPTVTLKDADGVLRRITVELEAGRARAWTMWAGVRFAHVVLRMGGHPQPPRRGKLGRGSSRGRVQG